MEFMALIVHAGSQEKEEKTAQGEVTIYQSVIGVTDMEMSLRSLEVVVSAALRYADREELFDWQGKVHLVAPHSKHHPVPLSPSA